MKKDKSASSSTGSSEQNKGKPLFSSTEKNVRVKLDMLTLNKTNPRIDGNDRQLRILKGSLQKIGQINPLIVDEYGVILSGNRRFKAMKELGWEYATVDVYTGLSSLFKDSILLSANSTQKLVNVWKNRELIARMYWDSFLKEYVPRNSLDKGYAEFARMIGCSDESVRKIVESQDQDNKVWSDPMRELNIGTDVIDAIMSFPKDRRMAIAKEVMQLKKDNLIASSRTDLRSMAYQLNQEIRIIEGSGMVSRRTLMKVIGKLRSVKPFMSENFLRGLDKDSKEKLKAELGFFLDAVEMLMED